MLENGRTVEQRLAMCRDLMGMANAREKADGNTRALVLIKHRAAATRRALLGSAGVAPDLADELLTPAQTEARLNGVLDGLEGKSDAERVRGALYVNGLASTLSALMKAESRLGAYIGFADFAAIQSRAQAILGADQAAQADHVLDAAISKGAFGDDLREELARAAAAGEVRRRSQNDMTVRLAAKYGEIMQKDSELSTRFFDLRRKGMEEEAGAVYKELMEFRQELLQPAQEAKQTLDREAREAEQSARATVGRKIISRVMDASPVTEDQASAWAAAQEITPQAKARFRKIGYAVDDVRRDMAEFYRFTGGRLPGVRIHSNGSRRANATDIEAHGKVGTINLDSSFDKRVLWHELGHHLEADPVAKTASWRYIRRRSADGKVYSLRSLSGNSGYRPNEVAFQGNFFNPYVGKVYRDGVTEVFSMGVETFSDPVLLAKRAVDDPQTLEFIAGYLSQPLDELGTAHMRLREILREAEDDAAQALESVAGDLVAQIAARLPLNPSEDRDWLGQQDWMYRDDKVLGYFNLPSGARWWVLSSKVMSYGSRRKVAGFRVLQPSDGGGISRASFPSKDLDLLKVAMLKYDKEGYFPGDLDRLKEESTLKALL